MAFDDDTGWTEILVDGWGPLVLAAVVERVERSTVGRRGVLLRALAEEEASLGHAACVEEVHELVVEAIRHETGADLDELGSQAAWACYDQVWGSLQEAWHRDPAATEAPRGLVAVAPVAEPQVTRLLQAMTARGAQHGGADVGTVPCTPLRVGGRLHVDVDGLFAYLARDTGEVTDADRALVDRLLLLVRASS